MITERVLGYKCIIIAVRKWKGEIKLKLNRIIEEKRKNVVVGTAIGTALGAAAGLLFAPKSGKETRGDITNISKDVAENIKVHVNDQIENTKEWSEKVMTEVKENWDELKEKKDEIDESAEIIKEEINEGIANVGEILKESNEDILDELND